jgi:thymidylate synthase
MNSLDKQYKDLLFEVLEKGVKKSDRTGTGTRSLFGKQIRHKMIEGFPLLTTKKMPFKIITTELLWFLRGDTNIKFLVDNGCHIWDGDAYKNYQLLMIGNEPDKILSMTDFIDKIKNDEKFAKHWGDLGPIYGKQWRSWEGLNSNTDQIKNLINDLKTNPDSRRLMVNAWNVGELDSMVLPPCHYGFQVYTKELSYKERYHIWFTNNYEGGMEYCEEIMPNFDDPYYVPTPTRSISLMWNQRSADLFLGLPFNIASYGLLLHILGSIVNMVPDELVGNLGDVHLYENHLSQSTEQLRREPIQLPKLVHMKTDEFYKSLSEDTSLFFHLKNTDFVVENYQSHPTIKAPLSN